MAKVPSGNFVLRVPPELHGRLRDLASRRGLSLNALCTEVLAAEVEEAANPSRGGDQQASAGPMARLIDRCRTVFDRQLLGVVHFGSTARGEASPASDVDLLLVLAPDVPLRRRLYTRWSSEVDPLAVELFEREVSPHFCHLPDAPATAGGLWLEVSIDGSVVWERDGVVSQALRRILGHLAGGGATRRMQHGHPYWVRERLPDAAEADVGGELE